jgi:hypothetical protein
MIQDPWRYPQTTKVRFATSKRLQELEEKEVLTADDTSTIDRIVQGYQNMSGISNARIAPTDIFHCNIFLYWVIHLSQHFQWQTVRQQKVPIDQQSASAC